MQIGNHMFGQSGFGVSRTGIMGMQQYRNVANKTSEDNATSQSYVATMLKRNMDSLELSPQAQKMMADKNESDNVSAQDVAKENSANGVENPTVTSQVPSAKETLVALGYDVASMSTTVTEKEEVVTERVLNEGVLVDLTPEKYDAESKGRSVTEIYNTMFLDENGQYIELTTEEVVQRAIDEYQKINESDLSDELKALEKSSLAEALRNRSERQDIYVTFQASGYSSEEVTNALAAAAAISGQINTSKDNMTENLIDVLKKTDGNISSEDAIAYMDKDAGKNGQLSFEDTYDIIDSLNFGGALEPMFVASVGELLGENRDGKGAMTAQSLIDDYFKGAPRAIRNWSSGAEDEFFSGVKEEDINKESSITPHITKPIVEEESWKSIMQAEVSKFLEDSTLDVEEVLETTKAEKIESEKAKLEEALKNGTIASTYMSRNAE